MTRLMVHLYSFQCSQIGHDIILNWIMQKKDGYFGHDFVSVNDDYIIINTNSMLLSYATIVVCIDLIDMKLIKY